MSPLHPPPPTSLSLSLSLACSLFVFCSFCCLCTNMSAVWLPGSQYVWGIYLITARLKSLRQWRLIWRGGPELFFFFLCPVPNTITLLFRYPPACYNFTIFQSQGLLKSFYWISCWTLLQQPFFSPAFTVVTRLSLWTPPSSCCAFSSLSILKENCKKEH